MAILLFACVMRDGTHLLMFGSEEIRKIKALQDKGVSLHMFGCVCELFICQSGGSVCKLFALMHMFVRTYTLRLCVSASTSESHIWLQIKWCMNEGNDRERKWLLFNALYLLSEHKYKTKNTWNRQVCFRRKRSDMKHLCRKALNMTWAL